MVCEFSGGAFDEHLFDGPELFEFGNVLDGVRSAQSPASLPLGWLV